VVVALSEHQELAQGAMVVKAIFTTEALVQ
jgi:hypothetical protein